MGAFFKIVIVSIVLLLVVFVGIMLWLDREHQISFIDNFPGSFETCHGMVSVESSEYKGLLGWFDANEDGWKNYSATIAPGYTYRSANLRIYVHPQFVVVNYQDNGEWRQVKNNSQTDTIYRKCDEGS